MEGGIVDFRMLKIYMSEHLSSYHNTNEINTIFLLSFVEANRPFPPPPRLELRPRPELRPPPPYVPDSNYCISLSAPSLLPAPTLPYMKPCLP